MKELKGKWCINITKDNVSYLKKHLRCGAGYYIHQTIFFNEDGVYNHSPYHKISWNVDRNNKCCDKPYNEISFEEFKNMIEPNIQPQYEIY